MRSYFLHSFSTLAVCQCYLSWKRSSLGFSLRSKFQALWNLKVKNLSSTHHKLAKAILSMELADRQPTVNFEWRQLQNKRWIRTRRTVKLAGEGEIETANALQSELKETKRNDRLITRRLTRRSSEATDEQKLKWKIRGSNKRRESKELKSKP